jgi:hypothetical protein
VLRPDVEQVILPTTWRGERTRRVRRRGAVALSRVSRRWARRWRVFGGGHRGRQAGRRAEPGRGLRFDRTPGLRRCRRTTHRWGASSPGKAVRGRLSSRETRSAGEPRSGTSTVSSSAAACRCARCTPQSMSRTPTRSTSSWSRGRGWGRKLTAWSLRAGRV